MATATSHSTDSYRGRFAPSPSGPLHQGSLLTALASYLDARHAGGHWLLRIEDIDPPREPPGAADAIRRCLTAHALHPDEPVLYQHTQSAAYDRALETLDAQGWLFRCSCTRRQLGPGGACGGRCADGATAAAGPTSLRVRVTADFDAFFTDLVQGGQLLQQEDVPRDFVVRRKDGLYAYQLAVVVDEAHQGITHVIRGMDLLPTTFQQRYLQQALGLPLPAYGHIPVITDTTGRKLSKQNRAPAADLARPLANLQQLLQLLRQPVPKADTPEALLEAAAKGWDREALNGMTRLVVTQ
ncbi:tRNA glutamyl-Q(34) synthetase GluQRS [Chromatocurvus halotolerans]|uniref:Glutamyl-Q tRNA(Asp) synthetase n=1 Tax=Chromatocurvus halotolerans TaxID=1132028 RepID=A0A4R2KQS5_9GAMM|nr:tRNA glutamyl-Q(34) synthetase GluQRS [Chromatocurvus halotolerans]TCO75072.1 glutamyl-Q tRNA(Asp) synthetase [Chromatocurvus halotolerans]